MVAPSPLGWDPIPARPRKPWRWVLGSVGLLIAAIIALNAVTVPYYAIFPGEAIAVDGNQGTVTVNTAHAGSGDLFLTTVTFHARVTVWDQLFNFAHPDVQLIAQRDLTGGVSASQYLAQNAQAMNDSELAAKVAALRRLGYVIPERGDGALVLQVGAGTAADGVLKEGDVITQIDARKVAVAGDATRAIRAHKPGDTVPVDVLRPGLNGSRPGPIHVTLKPSACGLRCPSDPGRALIGVDLATDQQKFDLPTQVGLNIESSNIGGPSAGLAFTLGIIDALTSRALTGGHRVAVTGTIDPDGTVGPVGGVKQKTVAVEQRNCEYFLVPPDEFAAATARAKGSHVKVVAVNNLEQALNFLRSINGDLSGVPAQPPPAS
ncbi:MAG: PDZ domain-containing protein [Acidimicrobiales bacterium]